MKNFLFLFLFILFSCQFDDNPISVDDINQDQLQYRKFDLNYDESKNNQILPLLDESIVMYAGNDTYGIIQFDYSNFMDYDLCSIDSLDYKSVYLVLDLINTYNSSDNDNALPENNFDIPDISAYWLNESDIKIYSKTDSIYNLQTNWLDSENFIKDSIYIDFTQINNENSRLFVDQTLGKYYIDISDKIIHNNYSHCEDYTSEAVCVMHDECEWHADEMACEDAGGPRDQFSLCDTTLDKILMIKSNSSRMYEFASSNYISDFINTEPYLSIVYDEFQQLNKTSNKVIVDDLIPLIANTNQFISDSLLVSSNFVFISNSNDDFISQELDDFLQWSDYYFYEPLLDSTQLEQDFNLVNINLNMVNKDNYDSTGIKFWLDNIKFLKYFNDYSNDNWNPLDSTGTEGNMIWDEGEYLEDFGLDMCSSFFEDGLGGCVQDSTLSAYNDLGTENNGVWDLGENFEDFGFDACPDMYEDSNDGCLCLVLDNCDVEPICEDNNLDGLCDNGIDPNLDNYNNDPSNDDWFDVNNNNQWDSGEGLEGNNQWDEGEPFLDVGIDGLKYELVGYSDTGEDNGLYDYGEPYFDTGIDSLYSTQENGYNIIGKQNDMLYQLGENFDDCGTDNDCNDNSILDDYNIDPNKDNWKDCGSDNICPTDINYIEPDLDGTELNGLWDANEGTELNFQHDSMNDISEIFDDFGIDNIEDLYEISNINSFNEISITDTIFYDMQGDVVQYFNQSTNQENDSLKLWISSISKQNDSVLVANIFTNSQIIPASLEFRLNHEKYSTQLFSWVNKERNVAKVNSNSFMKNLSLYKNNYQNISNESLLLNYSLGIIPSLNFDGFDDFIANNPGIVINENNSKMKLYFDLDNEDYILESNNFIIDFLNESDSISTIFSYYAPNNPDSLIIPLGNLVQQFITGEINYNNGLMIGLNPNQYPPSYNFNNIIIDKLKLPYMELYYFK